MDSPRHSVLISSLFTADVKKRIGDWLHRGIRVIWIGDETSCKKLNFEYKSFTEAFLLELHVSDLRLNGLIYDGQSLGQENFIDALNKHVETFNYPQYKVEHSENCNILVTASAGSGKTKVMIDRIIFLLDTVDNLEPSEIAMITFTNKATEEMSLKIHKAIFDRYRLATNPQAKLHYLSLFEKLSEIIISTIDSFSRRLLQHYSVELGYSHDFGLYSKKHEMKQLDYDSLDEYSDSDKHVKEQMGVYLYEADETIRKFWHTLVTKGLTKKEIDNLDWGTAYGDNKKLQNYLIDILKDLEWRYSSYKRYTDSMMGSELARELGSLLSEHNLDLRKLHLKYLFIDEFQDSNYAQITLARALVKRGDAKLFAVGDPKQSIYRFRGADVHSFEHLWGPPEDRLNLEHLSLQRNYRTSTDLINELDPIFSSCSRIEFRDNQKLLDYASKPPGRDDLLGEYEHIVLENRYNLDQHLYKLLSNLISDRERKERHGKIAVLVCTNRELGEIERICNPPDGPAIPLLIKKNNRLFRMDAARDLFSLISSFVFGHEPKSIFNYLLTPFSSLTETISMNQLIDCDGQTDKLKQLLNKYLSKTKWSEYNRDFRYQPAISVLEKIIETEPVMENYLKQCKKRDRLNANEIADKVNQYSADLDKLITLIHSEFSAKSVSLYDIYEYLRIHIVSDTDTEQAEIEPSGFEYLECMTIHKAKGKEFDTVVIPYEIFLPTDSRTQILLGEDRKTVGWEFYKETNKNSTNSAPKYVRLKNENFKTVVEEDYEDSIMEATRLLYVAMTRAERRLFIYTYTENKEKGYSWHNLIEGNFNWIGKGGRKEW